MSVSLVPKPETSEESDQSEANDEAVDESSTFHEVVVGDRDVCSSCFRRVRSDGQRAHDGIVGIDLEEKDAYGAIERPEARTTCRGCGSIGCGSLDETLSLQAAVDRVQPLADRLDEAGVDVNRDAMYYIVREGKQRESLAGHDHDLFELAVRVGVREAGCGPVSR